MIKYFTNNEYNIVDTEIEKVEIERETRTGVWIDGRREAKDGRRGTYHDSWEEARYHLVECANSKISKFNGHIKKAERAIEKLKGMKAPEKLIIHHGRR